MTMHHRTASFSARALAFGLATGLALVPVTGRAAPTAAPPPEVTAPETAPEPAPPPAEPTEPTEPAAPTDVAQPEPPAEPAEPTDVTQPEPEPEPQPEPEPEPQPEPQPEPEPKVTTPPAPAVAHPVDDTPVDLDKARRLRVGGLGTLIAGGGLALTGVALGIGFTVSGKAQKKKQDTVEDSLALDDCSMSDSSTCNAHRADFDSLQDKIDGANNAARIGGILVLAGAVGIVVGGVIHRRGVKMEEQSQARLRFSPTLGGAVLSGRF